MLVMQAASRRRPGQSEVTAGELESPVTARTLRSTLHHPRAVEYPHPPPSD